METKVCSKCGEEKPFTDFYKNRMCKDGYRNICKECCKAKQQEYRTENYDTIIEKKREDYYNNRDIILDKKKKQYYISQKEIQKKYRFERYNNDALYKLTHNIRCRVRDFLKSKNITKNNKTFDFVGCSPDFLKKHIENQFLEGMSWDNYGYKGWHIDHYIPLSSAKTEEDVYRLNNYTNLQPLWWHENLSKGDKLPEEWLSENTSN